MATKTPPTKAPNQRALQEQLRRAQTELTLAETKYTTTLLDQLTKQEANFALRDPDEDNWIQMGSGGAAEKDLSGLAREDPALLRKRAYWFWRTNPHARGIIRNFERFIVGREFAIDFEDTERGTWNEDRTQLVPSTDEDAPLIVRELWDDFAEVNMFTNRMKEAVRRTFRDGGVFIQKFDREGFITLRFIEPARVQGHGAGNPSSPGLGTVRDGDVEDVVLRSHPDIVGKATHIVDGIEYLATDPETTIAYHVGDDPLKTQRIPARDVIQTKPYADFNDQRGLLLLEVVMRHLTNYAQWEEYRMVLNKVRTAVALVRKVEGTATQASNIIAGRASPRAGVPGTEPQTLSGRREAMPKAGTIITAGPGVDWEFKRPNLDARDASEDGRRILLSVSAGVGLPEMLVTGDWSNSNYSSSVESRTPAVREWEDWQEFFEPVIKRIVHWVVEAAKLKLKLPDSVSGKIAIQWPSIISKDSDKETNRYAVLHAHGIMSKKTWSANEGFIFDEEVQNFKEEADLDIPPPTGIPPTAAAGGTGPDGRPVGPDPQPGMPRSPRPSQSEARAQLLKAAAEMHALFEQQEASESIRMAMENYTRAVNSVLDA